MASVDADVTKAAIEAAIAAKKQRRRAIDEAITKKLDNDETKIDMKDEDGSLFNKESGLFVRALELLRDGTKPISINSCKATPSEHATIQAHRTILHKLQTKHVGENELIINARNKALGIANDGKGTKMTKEQIDALRIGKEDWEPKSVKPCSYGAKCRITDPIHKTGFAHPSAGSIAVAAAAPAPAMAAAAPAMAAPAMAAPAMAAPAMAAPAMAAPAMAVASDQKAIVKDKIRILETLVKDTKIPAEKAEYEKELTIERHALAALIRMSGGRRKSSKKTSKRKSKKSSKKSLKGGSKKRSKKSSKKSSKRKSKKSK